MADQRPGGLTTLAVFNFIFGGFSVILTLILLAAVAVIEAGVDGTEVNLKDTSIPLLYVSLLLTIISAGLLITSGVGYIKQKLFIGRKLGNAYVACSLIGTTIGIAAGDGFGVSTIIMVIYPLLTVFLINTTFKEDLVN